MATTQPLPVALALTQLPGVQCPACHVAMLPSSPHPQVQILMLCLVREAFWDPQVPTPGPASEQGGRPGPQVTAPSFRPQGSSPQVTGLSLKESDAWTEAENAEPDLEPPLRRAPRGGCGHGWPSPGLGLLLGVPGHSVLRTAQGPGSPHGPPTVTVAGSDGAFW